jgi:acetate kinase
VTRRWVLVLNAGSSSLKYQAVDPESGAVAVADHVERVDETGLDEALDGLTRALEANGVNDQTLFAVGHRVVHGGSRFTSPVIVDDDVLAEIESLSRLAPLHNPPAAEGIRHARTRFPDITQVAVFDTGFFADLPRAAATYAIDHELAEREQVRRYGAHGISHEYVAAEAARVLGKDGPSLVTLHLGNGASAAAVRDGRPLDTSMGLTPLEGLVMGTRGGDVDPGALLHLMRHADLDVDQLEDLLHHRSGLEGLAGVHDFRDLMSAIDDGDVRARTAYEVYCHRLRKYVGAYHAVLGGADAVVFTAGVGEHNSRLRADALAGLEALGISIDEDRNRADEARPRVISRDDAAVAVLVVPTNEELSIARQAARLLGDSHDRR